ncbi:YiiX/YebB-like N1pC/P60 family cysteine hydrolase [Rhodohalobacter sp. 8-1]|uniref:YiiX/YebB-like N1pC/P60 family cysteine hydrolase n=1 Tax=Rhodohalobacter sp. 8-1 TaxID=3131972 RepID=UPI0030EB8B14
MSSLLNNIGYRLAHFLSDESEEQQTTATCTTEALKAALNPGDVLLVDGGSRISMAIKYITQSTWSHATLYIGQYQSEEKEEKYDHALIEADLKKGVRIVPLNMYCSKHMRICRPVGLSSEEIQQICDYMLERIGYQYDLKNIFDLARYLIQTPPVPKKHRRKLLALGSGDPTKAICSSLIAQAFQQVNYPILPVLDPEKTNGEAAKQSQEEILHIRHHSLFAPRDFDVSPYFQIVKPSIRDGFNHHNLKWADESNGEQYSSE